MRKSHHQANELIQIPKFNIVSKKKMQVWNMKGKKEGILSSTILFVK